jgi:hypothetical protein
MEIETGASAHLHFTVAPLNEALPALTPLSTAGCMATLMCAPSLDIDCFVRPDPQRIIPRLLLN